MDKLAKFKFSLTNGELEIEGSEEFVTQQIEKFKDVILNIKATPSPAVGTPSIEEPLAEATTDATDVLNPEIFEEDEDMVQIVADIPGNTKANQTLNVAILLAYAYKKKGIKEILVDNVKLICQNHGCLDSPNFSAHIKKGDPNLYIDKGKGKSRTIKLTVPGEKKALEIIDAILEKNVG